MAACPGMGLGVRGPQLHPLSLCLCPQGQADAEDTEGKHRPLSPPCAEPRPCLLLFPRRFPAQFPPGMLQGDLSLLLPPTLRGMPGLFQGFPTSRTRRG